MLFVTCVDKIEEVHSIGTMTNPWSEDSHFGMFFVEAGLSETGCDGSEGDPCPIVRRLREADGIVRRKRENEAARFVDKIAGDMQGVLTDDSLKAMAHNLTQLTGVIDAYSNETHMTTMADALSQAAARGDTSLKVGKAIKKSFNELVDFASKVADAFGTPEGELPASTDESSCAGSRAKKSFSQYSHALHTSLRRACDEYMDVQVDSRLTLILPTYRTSPFS